MGKSIITAGLDMGSSHAVVVIGQKNEESGEITILGAGRAPCRGLKGGVVVNIPESKLSINRAVEIAESQAKETVENLLVGIRGSHIETFNHRGAIAISRTDKEIASEDVENVMVNAKAIQLSSDREILHTVAQDYSVDKQAGVEDPEGMEGSHLAVDVHIAVASSSHINNVIKAINQAGFTCEDLIYGAFAVGDCLVAKEEKDLGAALVDIGGQTTYLSFYADGSIRYTKELPIGGEFISRDIAYGLKTTFAFADDLKEKYGRCLTGLTDPNEMIEFLAVDGRSKKQVSTRVLAEIIQSRVEEIFEMVAQELQKSNYADAIPGGVILTGGCSKLLGIDKVAEQVLQANVHLGCPIGVEGPPEIVMDPVYSTAIGLLKYKHEGEWASTHRTLNGDSFFKKIRNWVDDII